MKSVCSALVPAQEEIANPYWPLFPSGRWTRITARRVSAVLAERELSLARQHIDSVRDAGTVFVHAHGSIADEGHREVFLLQFSVSG